MRSWRIAIDTISAHRVLDTHPIRSLENPLGFLYCVACGTVRIMDSFQEPVGSAGVTHVFTSNGNTVTGACL